MNRRRQVLGAAFLSVLVLAIVPGCGHGGAEGEAQASTADRVVPVTVAPLERRTIEQTVEAVGTLRGWEQVTVGSKRTGRVVRVLHDMGDRVQPEEPLVELEAVDAQLKLKQAESKYLGELVRLGITAQQADEFVNRYGMGEELLRGKVAEEAIERVPSVVQMRVSKERAEHNLARQRALAQRGASTAQELEDMEHTFHEAEATYQNAKFLARNVIANALSTRIAMNQAKQELQDMTIVSPTPQLLPPGTNQSTRLEYGVTRRSVAEGQMIREGEAVAELVIEDPLRLWMNVPERYTDSVQSGQLVRVTVPSHPDLPFEGKVVRINPSVDATSRTFQVEALIPNERGLLRPGGFAKAAIVTDAKAEAAVVPLESVVRFAGVTKLFIVENGKAHTIDDLQTGVEGRGWIQVISQQLPASAEVVTTGQTQLAEGTAIVIRQPGAADAGNPEATASGTSHSPSPDPSPTSTSNTAAQAGNQTPAPATPAESDPRPDAER
jgi:multidrug efflux pump subunit AcrA (membrane-fusion protein)